MFKDIKKIEMIVEEVAEYGTFTVNIFDIANMGRPAVMRFGDTEFEEFEIYYVFNKTGEQGRKLVMQFDLPYSIIDGKCKLSPNRYTINPLSPEIRELNDWELARPWLTSKDEEEKE